MTTTLAHRFLPPPLIHAINNSQGMQNLRGVEGALRDRTTRVAYAAWAYHNYELVRTNPDLQTINRIAMQIDPTLMPWATVIGKIRGIFNPLMQNNSDYLKNEMILLHGGLKGFFTVQFTLDRIRPLYSYVGIATLLPYLSELDPTIISMFLSVQDEHGNTPLHNEGILAILMPTLSAKFKEAHADSLLNMLGVKNKQGKNPLHAPESACHVSSYLKKILSTKPEQYKKLLIQDASLPLTLDQLMNFLNRLFLRDLETASYFIDFFADLSGSDILTILPKFYERAVPLLHNPSTLLLVLPHLSKCTVDQIDTLLQGVDSPNKIMRIALGSPELVSATAQLLGKTHNVNELMSLLEDVDLEKWQVQVLLRSEHLSVSHKLTILFMEKMEFSLGGRISNVLSLSPLASKNIFDSVKGLLESLNSKTLCKLFKGKDDRPPFFAPFLAYYYASSNKEFFRLESMCSSQYISYFYSILPFFEKIETNDVYSIFSKMDGKELTALFSLVPLNNEFRALLKRFSFSQLLNFLLKMSTQTQTAVPDTLWGLLREAYNPSDLPYVKEVLFTYNEENYPSVFKALEPLLLSNCDAEFSV